MAHPFRPVSTETAPLLGLFGPLAGVVGVIVRAEPSLALRIMQSPPRAIHAVAIFLHETACPDEANRLSDVVSETHPRDLLRKRLPTCDQRLYRLLDRAALPAWSRCDYLALDE